MMAAPRDVTVTGCAYAKMVMHAMKHSQYSVCGLLIGPVMGKSGEKSHVLCTDAVPLLHTHMLHPQLRLGVEMVEEICEMSWSDPSDANITDGARNYPVGAKPHRIVGFYYCDVLTVPEKMPFINREAQHIAQVLRQHYPDLLLCLMNMQELMKDQPVLVIWVPSGSSWTRLPFEALRCSDAALQMAKRSVSDLLYLNLVDLDDHLFDHKLSPLNPSVLSSLKELVAEDVKYLTDIKCFPVSSGSKKAPRGILVDSSPQNNCGSQLQQSAAVQGS